MVFFKLQLMGCWKTLLSSAASFAVASLNGMAATRGWMLSIMSGLQGPVVLPADNSGIQ
jgi:hypothetical protein